MGRLNPSSPQAHALIQQSGLFNAKWYVHHYPDVAAAKGDPLQHYLARGGFEGREPGPEFDTGLYIRQCPQAAESGMAPLLHYIQIGREQGAQPEVLVLPGKQDVLPGRPTVLICAHAAGEEMFGAERSFLDVLQACTGLQLNVLASVPTMANSDYMHALSNHCQNIFRVCTEQWQAGKKACPWAVHRFADIVREQGVDLVQANTIMLREPLLAARQAGVPAVVHVRESLAHDKSLGQTIGLNPEQMYTQVMELADYILANSAFTARVFHKPGATHRVGNVIHLQDYDLPQPASGEGMRVALISSNQPKKGLDDFVQVAGLVQDMGVKVRMLLIGPDNEHVHVIRHQQQNGLLPGNIDLAGYARTPQEAMTQADVVLNLSHFEETFGRTVLEAMAAGRPVIAYRWGALPELVEDGGNGFLVPFGDVHMVAEKIRILCHNQEMAKSMGQAGKRMAAEHTLVRMKDQLYTAYTHILPLANPL